MRNRDENLALRSLTAAVETQTQFLRVFVDKVDAQFGSINSRLDTIEIKLDGIITRLDEFHAEFATHRHGDDGEVV